MNLEFINIIGRVVLSTIFFANVSSAIAQKPEMVKIVKVKGQNKYNVMIGEKPFTSFLYPDTLEKPVLYPVYAVDGMDVTRGFPLHPKKGDPTDHPHHIGIWFNYENVDGLDFWNNSYAIPTAKKSLYGWIKTDRIIEAKSGEKGILSYHANWVNQGNDVLLEEITRLIKEERVNVVQVDLNGYKTEQSFFKGFTEAFPNAKVVLDISNVCPQYIYDILVIIYFQEMLKVKEVLILLTATNPGYMELINEGLEVLYKNLEITVQPIVLTIFVFIYYRDSIFL